MMRVGISTARSSTPSARARILSVATCRLIGKAQRRCHTSATAVDYIAAASAVSEVTGGTPCCGGTVRLKSPVKLLCYNEQAVGRSQAVVLKTPVPRDDLTGLLSLCKQKASCSEGGTFDTASFTTNFSLVEHGILSTMTLMMPKATGTLTAQLCNLTFNCAGDPPQPPPQHSSAAGPEHPDVFGRLVVCLPQPHTGGQLSIRPPPASQRNQQHPGSTLGSTFDWATASVKPGTAQWAAFYSDSPHEILPVQSGHRITLTYNLLLTRAPETEPLLAGLSPSSLALYRDLKAALTNPDFMPTGGTLGFGCQHAYPHTQEQLSQAVPSMLKGGDAAVLAVARALGLRAEVQAAYEMTGLRRDPYDIYEEAMYGPGGYDYDEEGEEQEGEEEEEDDEEADGLRLKPLEPQSCVVYYRFRTKQQVVQMLFPGSTSDEHVTWCTDPRGGSERHADPRRDPERRALQLVSAVFHNWQAIVRQWYTTPVILVTVPASMIRT